MSQKCITSSADIGQSDISVYEFADMKTLEYVSKSCTILLTGRTYKLKVSPVNLPIKYISEKAILLLNLPI